MFVLRGTFIDECCQRIDNGRRARSVPAKRDRAIFDALFAEEELYVKGLEAQASHFIGPQAHEEMVATGGVMKVGCSYVPKKDPAVDKDIGKDTGALQPRSMQPTFPKVRNVEGKAGKDIGTSVPQAQKEFRNGTASKKSTSERSKIVDKCNQEPRGLRVGNMQPTFAEVRMEEGDNGKDTGTKWQKHTQPKNFIAACTTMADKLHKDEHFPSLLGSRQTLDVSQAATAKGKWGDVHHVRAVVAALKAARSTAA